MNSRVFQNKPECSGINPLINKNVFWNRDIPPRIEWSTSCGLSPEAVRVGAHCRSAVVWPRPRQTAATPSASGCPNRPCRSCRTHGNRWPPGCSCGQGWPGLPKPHGWFVGVTHAHPGAFSLVWCASPVARSKAGVQICAARQADRSSEPHPGLRVRRLTPPPGPDRPALAVGGVGGVAPGGRAVAGHSGVGGGPAGAGAGGGPLREVAWGRGPVAQRSPVTPPWFWKGLPMMSGVHQAQCAELPFCSEEVSC